MVRVEDRRGMDEPFLASECVSCGACVACPTATLIEKTVVDSASLSTRLSTVCASIVESAATSKLRCAATPLCAWCPGRTARRTTTRVKGRFAWGYANHQDRIMHPMMREKITDPWREVSWEEAITALPPSTRRIQAAGMRADPSASSRLRAARRRNVSGAETRPPGVRHNNTDTCARTRYLPRLYGLSTPGPGATQNFDSVEQAEDHGRRCQSDRRSPAFASRT